MLIANFSSFLTNIRCTFKIAIKGTINFYDNDEANRCIFYSHLLWSSPNFRFTSKQNHTDLKVFSDFSLLVLFDFSFCFENKITQLIKRAGWLQWYSRLFWFLVRRSRLEQKSKQLKNCILHRFCLTGGSTLTRHQSGMKSEDWTTNFFSEFQKTIKVFYKIHFVFKLRQVMISEVQKYVISNLLTVEASQNVEPW